MVDLLKSHEDAIMLNSKREIAAVKKQLYLKEREIKILKKNNYLQAKEAKKLRKKNALLKAAIYGVSFYLNTVI